MADYTIVFDDNYEKLCPWADIVKSGTVWPDGLANAAMEIFALEKTIAKSAADTAGASQIDLSLIEK